MLKMACGKCNSDSGGLGLTLWGMTKRFSAPRVGVGHHEHISISSTSDNSKAYWRKFTNLHRPANNTRGIMTAGKYRIPHTNSFNRKLHPSIKNQSGKIFTTQSTGSPRTCIILDVAWPTKSSAIILLCVLLGHRLIPLGSRGLIALYNWFWIEIIPLPEYSNKRVIFSGMGLDNEALANLS